jgi:hypothetical protein
MPMFAACARVLVSHGGLNGFSRGVAVKVRRVYNHTTVQPYNHLLESYGDYSQEFAYDFRQIRFAVADRALTRDGGTGL